MLHPLVIQAPADTPAVSAPQGRSASPQTRRHQSVSRPTTLVVHSRLHAVRFRILVAPATTALPVSLLPEAQDVPESDGLLWPRNL